MAIAGGTMMAEEVRERLTPALETLDETMRRGRGVIIGGQQAADDAIAGVALKIRKRPLSSVIIAAGAGALVGAVMAVTLGRLARCAE